MGGFLLCFFNYLTNLETLEEKFFYVDWNQELE